MNAFIPAPKNPDQWQQWREHLKAWRNAERALTNYTEPSYVKNAAKWGSQAYCQAVVMLWDEELIDHRTLAWKVDTFVERTNHQFGGFDTVVLWNNYPLSGVDSRNQYDYFFDLPGGLEGLKDVVDSFHKHSIKVMIDYKPWIKGVPEGCNDDAEGMAMLVEAIGADGVYLDCASHPIPTMEKSIKALGEEKTFSSEATTPLDKIGVQPSSWMQFCDDSDAPGIIRNRWFERYHLVYETRRYYHHPMHELHRAWLNGGGTVIWENVFGYWAPYSPRYCSWLRLMLPAQRRYSALFLEGNWEPLVNSVGQDGLYASHWFHEGIHLWTLCNRSGKDIKGALLRLGSLQVEHTFDIIRGAELEVTRSGSDTIISGTIGTEGIAGVLLLENEELEEGLGAFLQQQSNRFDEADWTFVPWQGEHRLTDVPHRLFEIGATEIATEIPDGMVLVNGKEFTLQTQYLMRECGYIAGTTTEKHVYDSFHETCIDERPVSVKDFAIDRTSVTNAQYYRFLQETNYKPEHTHQFLAHWENGVPPEGLEDHPVVYISIEDARAYASWRNARLPREEEWQRAAQGDNGRLWPWGNEFNPHLCNDGTYGRTTPVDTFAEGASPFGCIDMVGNTWEMTESIRTDGHTRYMILKGGSWYIPTGSKWFFDSGPKPVNWGAKLILLWPGWDRCATIGFRCVVDL